MKYVIEITIGTGQSFLASDSGKISEFDTIEEANKKTSVIKKRLTEMMFITKTSVLSKEEALKLNHRF